MTWHILKSGKYIVHSMDTLQVKELVLAPYESADDYHITLCNLI
jgi:hypothetical protein